MTNFESSHASRLDHDPVQLKAAAAVLEDFTELRWKGGDTNITLDIFGRTRDAALLIIDGIKTNRIGLMAPIAEALGASREDEEGYLNRIEQLHAEHVEEVSNLNEELENAKKRAKGFEKAYELLHDAADEAVSDLSKIETFGDRNPVAGAIHELRSALDEAVDHLPSDEQ